MAVEDHADADLMSIGQHCAFSGCQQLDFLPFVCGSCNRTFCLEHRTCSSHACPKAGANEVTTIICPLCAKAIKLVGDEDPHLAFDKHSRSGACDPSNYSRVNAKKRCPVPGCREKLTSTNTYCCKDCKVNVCLKHRFGADHACKGKQGAAAAAASARFSRLFKGSGSGGGGGAAGSRPSSQPRPQAGAAGGVGETVAMAWSKQSEKKPQPVARPPPTMVDLTADDVSERARLEAAPQRRPQQREVCPHCHRSLPDLLALITHVERVHLQSVAA